MRSVCVSVRSHLKMFMKIDNKIHSVHKVWEPVVHTVHDSRTGALNLKAANHYWTKLIRTTS